MTHSLVYSTPHSEKDSVLSEIIPTPSSTRCSPQTSMSRLSYESSHSSECSTPTVAPIPTPKTSSSDTLVSYDARKTWQPSTTRLVVAHA
ncbi:hypothetical protein DICSQDRAFT_150952, partial [Dichomitus squalens LYAD-421 SS1]|uniref:uncharacterized protein n=1 Tax=Dichomitus squalens (strain LYAD-421) TaxID=732165 RepID=UPI000441536C